MGDHGSQSDRTISIAEKLAKPKEEDLSDKWKKVCIYRVPRNIKGRNPEFYEPKIVSFGPYHSSNPKLREADPHKWRALHYMLKRNNHEVAQYLDAVKEHEQRARSCYEEEISLSSDQFVEMMVLDGCFLIECLLRYKNYSNAELGYPDNIPFFNVDEMIFDVTSDMLLVENQIPLFVLYILAAMQTNPVVDKPFIDNVATNIFNEWISGVDARSSSLMDKEGFNILDMVMQKQVFDVSKFTLDENVNVDVIPCASKLKEAGLKFISREDNLLWLIEFSERTLKLPKLCFQNGSEEIFHNAVGYEQRHPGCVKVILYYVFLMSQLIRSPKDVDHLTEAKIIQNLRSNEELVKLFSDMNLVFDCGNHYLHDITNQINRHCNTR